MAKNVSSAATRSVPEWIASDSSPRLFVAIPAASLTEIRTQAASTEASAVRRCGLTREESLKCGEPAFAGSPAGAELDYLRGGDVAPEGLLQERAGTVALVPPVAVEKALVLLRVVAVIELAVLAVRQARELSSRAEERGDERRLTTRRRAGGVRVERATRDRPGDVTLHRADLAGSDCCPMLGLVLETVAGADTGERDERCLVLLTDAVRAVLLLVDLDRALDRVGRPRIARAAVVGRRDHDRGLVRMRLLVLVTVTRIRQGERRESERRNGDDRKCDESFQVNLPFRMEE